MRKNIKKLPKKILATLMIFGMMLQIFMPTVVLAVTYQDANTVTIGGSPTLNGNTFNYANGSVTITKNSLAVNTTSFTVEQDDVIKIMLAPAENYHARLHNEVQNYDVTLVNNVFEFTIGRAEGGTLTLTPFFSNDSGQPDPSIEDLKFDLTINGESFTNVSIGDEVVVSDNFNMDTLEEFYVTKIIDGERRTYTYANEEYSYEMLDSQDKHILETHFIKKSNNYANLRVEAHANDILESDITRYHKTKEDYFGFYITGIKFIKSSFKGVEVSTDIMPDNYDFTVWNGADLSDTTISNPGIVTAYYGEDTISLNSSNASSIKKIELVKEKGVPNDAVEINSENGTIRILSNYYNQIPVKVELEDGTIGYVTINRIGIFIGDLNKDQNTFYHGAVNDSVQGNLNVETNKQRLVAVFYHENTTTYDDYDLIVNITYINGTTETKIATGVGDVNNMAGDIIGSDYILWSGDSIDDTLEKVSVTAVKKGAITDKTTFGGATFGSGSGVVWEKE